ncbi:MAG TPA: YdeI/OmpD-associated family protein [Dehalococcoidia bacterium]|nr:YdeI/OmpD-associated family protein [Dehalococcoidia bacterium]
MEPLFFASPEEFRAWLGANHETAQELWVGFHKRGTGRPSLTWPQSVDQALCFGWIDGIRKSLGPEAYVIRFTPRRPDSFWSNINLKKVEALIEQGLMHPAGLRAFEARKEARSGAYSFENRHIQLAPAFEAEFRANEEAWRWFESQAPWYRRTAAFWVMSARREETRRRRLVTLIRDSEAGRTVGPLTRPGAGQ